MKMVGVVVNYPQLPISSISSSYLPLYYPSPPPKHSPPPIFSPPTPPISSTTHLLLLSPIPSS